MQKKPIVNRFLAVSAAALMVTALAACEQKSASTPGEKLDTAIAKTEQSAEKAKESTANAAAEAKTDLSAAGSQAGAAIKEAGADAKAALEKAGTATGAAVDDAAITTAVNTGLAKDPDLSAIKINVDTKAGEVTLSGPAPSAAAKSRAEEIAKGVSGVKSVTNNLEVKAG